MPGQKPRRGSAMVIAMVALVVVATLAAGLTTALVALHRQSRVSEQQMQAEWLADSALQRTAAQLARDPNFTGETWTTVPLAEAAARIAEAAAPTAEPSKADADLPRGVVVIRVLSLADSPNRRRVTIAARYPDDPIQRVLATRDTTISLPTTGAAQ